MTAALIGSAIAGAASQGGLGFGLAAFNNKKAAEMAERDRYENFMYNEQSAAAADARTRKLYEDLQSPAALLAQYKAAGLSPSLMFGGGGGAGGSVPQGAQGAGAGGVQTTFTPVNPFDAAGIAVAYAQARKLNAEADTEEGLNERGAKEIKKLIAETGNVELQNEFQALQNMLTHWQTQIEGNTLNEAIEARKISLKRVAFELQELKETIRSLKVKADIDEKTEESVIKYITGKVAEQAAMTYALRTRGDLNKKGLEVSDAQIAELYSKVLYNSEVIRIEEEKLKINRDQLEAQIEQWAVENGLQKRAQNIKIGEIITHHIENGENNLTDVVREVIPSINLKPANKIGFE